MIPQYDYNLSRIIIGNFVRRKKEKYYDKITKTFESLKHALIFGKQLT